MVQQESCQGCHQRDDCQKVYEQLGNIKSPSVAVKVVLAFLLPLVVFILSLAVFEKILAGSFDSGQLRTAVAFLLALLATLICILIVKFTNRHFGQNR
ncbi:MAG: SoxR reducing system RseC family protein [Planctomycetota bacterium]